MGPHTNLTRSIEQTKNETSLLDSMKTLLYSWIKDAVAEAFQEQMNQEAYCYPKKVTVIQASEITGYTKNSLYQMHSKNQIPGALKVGGKLLFDTEALREWVNKGGNIV